MKIYIEIEEPGDIIGLSAFEDALRQLIRISATSGFDMLKATPQQMVYAQSTCADQLTGNVLSATFTNKPKMEDEQPEETTASRLHHYD